METFGILHTSEELSVAHSSSQHPNSLNSGSEIHLIIASYYKKHQPLAYNSTTMASLRSLAVLRRSLVVRTFHSTALRRGGPGPPLPAFKRSPPKWETVRIIKTVVIPYHPDSNFAGCVFDALLLGLVLFICWVFDQLGCS